VNLLEGDQDELLAMLVAGRIELMLAYSFAIPDEVAAEPLAELPPYAVLAADHRLAGRERVRLRELSQELFLLLDLPHSRDYFFGLFRSLGVEPRVVFRSRSQELIRGLAAHGHGFAIQNAIAGSTVTYDGTEVATVAFEEELPATRLMALRLRQHTMRPAVRAFAEFLSASFAPGGIFAPGSITAPQAAAPSARPQARSQRRQARR
jgi:DNA-binding transcriptional LysR family regulator